MLALHLFGPPEILLDGQEIKLTRRKSRALLFYLAAQPRPLTREHLLGLFWPDAERASAQQILRTTLHGLRKEIGEALQIEDERLYLAPEVEVDVRRFSTLLGDPNAEPAARAEAIRLYRGEFLAEFYLPDSLAFENWLTMERERLRRMVIRALAAQSQEEEAGGDLRSALDRLDHALRLDLLQEDLQREAIRLLYQLGDRPGAIQRYDQLRRLLDEEMGVPPMRETRSLYDDILNDRLPSGASARAGRPSIPGRRQTASAAKGALPADAAGRLRQAARSLPFTGRQKELDQLRLLAESQIAHPAARMVLIEGEAGIGKSRLADEFIHSTSLLPLAGSGYELEQSIPYRPVVEALRSLTRRPDWPELERKLVLQPVWKEEISRLLPELHPGGVDPAQAAPTNEARLWEGVHQFLSAAARLQPLVVFLDDLHWADSSTLALLGYLVRQTSAPVVYLAAARPATPRSPLAGLITALLRSAALTQLSLQRLSPEEVSALAVQVTPEYAYPFASWLMAHSEGSPYILAELLRYSLESGVTTPAGQVNLSALSSTPVVPPTVYSLTQSRLNQLSGQARRVLDTAIALGREFAVEVVYQAAGLSEAAAQDALDELGAAGLVVPAAGAEGEGELFYYAFTHSIFLEVAGREMGEGRHRQLHRRVAEALEKVHARMPSLPVGQIAYHYLEGGSPTEAAPFAFQAGLRAADVAAWIEAIDFFEKALLGETAPARRREILTHLAQARYNSGQVARAAEDYRAAAALARPNSPEQAEIQLNLGMALLTQGRYAEVISLVHQIQHSEQPELHMRSLFLWGTALSLEGSDLEEAKNLLHQAENFCRSCSGPLPLADIKFELGGILAQQGDLAGAVALYHESKEEAEKAGEAGTLRRILAYNNLAYHLHLLEDEQARGFAQTGLELAQEKGFLTTLPYLYSTLGEIALAKRDVQVAEEMFTRGLDLAERYNNQERVAGLLANLGLAAREQGQVELAIHQLSTALARADALGTRHLATQIRIWLAPLLPPAKARAYLAEARDTAESSQRMRLLDEIRRQEEALL